MFGDGAAVRGLERTKFASEWFDAGVAVEVESQRVLGRELFRTFGASVRLDLLMDRLLVVLQRRVRRQLNVANVADFVELVMVEVMRRPLLLTAITSVAQVAFDARLGFLKIVERRLACVAFQALLVRVQLRFVGKCLVALGASDVGQVVDAEQVLVERDSIGELGARAVAALERFSDVQVDQVDVLGERELMGGSEVAVRASERLFGHFPLHVAVRSWPARQPLVVDLQQRIAAELLKALLALELRTSVVVANAVQVQSSSGRVLTTTSTDGTIELENLQVNSEDVALNILLPFAHKSTNVAAKFG